MLVAGVDGCKNGWLVVLVNVSAKLRLSQPPLISTFGQLVQDLASYASVGIDIPIGLSQGPERAADQKARKLLGEPRARSVFRAPCWPVLDDTTNETEYLDVCTVSRKYCLRQDGQPSAMSQQAWRIMPKVREANLRMTPHLQKTIVEVHPEVSFYQLSGYPMPYKKKSSSGKRNRLCALEKVFDGDLTDIEIPNGAARDDFYDACVAAWSASRFATRRHGTLPEEPPLDSRGLRMEIVY